MSKWRLARRIAHTSLLLAAVACQACLPAPPEPVGTASSSIVAGKAAAACEWPSVGVLLPSGCSGALIQRRAFATAAHCLFDAGGRLEAPSTVLFGQRRNRPELQVGVSMCFLSEPRDSDFAVCVLSDEAPGIPIIPLMAPCEDEWLAPGETAIEVGFGQTSAVAATDEDSKSWLEVTVVRARSDEPYLEVSAGSQAGEYYGDSGGPLFFKMPDGTWRMVGTDSGSPDIVPDSSAPRFSVYANAPHFLGWAEQVTGLDLTPCHDESGWHPGASCAAFPVSQPQAEGSWANYCSDQPTARPEPSCPESSSAGAGVGGEKSGHAFGEGGASPAPARAGNDLPAQPLRLAGGGCSQATGTPGAWSSTVAMLLVLLGLRRRELWWPVPAAHANLARYRAKGR